MRKQVLFDGESLEYDDLVLALGSQPRRLPEKIGGSLGKVFTVRDLTDVDALAPEFTRDKRVLIIGGGYIGLEAAAVAAQRGLKVTLVEMADRILQRVALPQTSDYFRHLHTTHGVEIKEGVSLARLTGHEGTVTGAELSDGTLIEIDFAIVGVGIFPVTDIASDAGLSISDGITVNAFGKPLILRSGRQGIVVRFLIGVENFVWKASLTPLIRRSWWHKTSWVHRCLTFPNLGSGLINMT